MANATRIRVALPLMHPAASSAERALAFTKLHKQFKNAVRDSALLGELKLRSVYESPGRKRRSKLARAERTRLKEERRAAERK